jgi:predicted sugar kinase
MAEEGRHAQSGHVHCWGQSCQLRVLIHLGGFVGLTSQELQGQKQKQTVAPYVSIYLEDMRLGMSSWASIVYADTTTAHRQGERAREEPR